MNFYECDNCSERMEAVRSGIYQLLPDGWFVVADGPVNKREIELHLCSKQCMATRVDKIRLLGTIPEADLVVKAIRRLSHGEVVDC